MKNDIQTDALSDPRGLAQSLDVRSEHKEYPVLSLTAPGSLEQLIEFSLSVFGSFFSVRRLTAPNSQAVRGVTISVLQPCFVELKAGVLANDLLLIWRQVKGARLDDSNGQRNWLVPVNSIELLPIGESGTWRFDESAIFQIFEIDYFEKISIAKIANIPSAQFRSHIENAFDESTIKIVNNWEMEKLNAEKSASDSKVKHIDTIFIYNLLLKYGDKHNSETTATDSFSKFDQCKIRSFIDKDLSNGISVSEMAIELGLDDVIFRRLFRLTFGISPYQFIIQRRVENAMVMLQSATLSLAEIALDLGFSSQAHMSIVFSKYVGMAPGRYRRLKRGGKTLADIGSI